MIITESDVNSAVEQMRLASPIRLASFRVFPLEERGYTMLAMEVSRLHSYSMFVISLSSVLAERHGFDGTEETLKMLHRETSFYSRDLDTTSIFFLDTKYSGDEIDVEDDSVRDS